MYTLADNVRGLIQKKKNPGRVKKNLSPRHRALVYCSFNVHCLYFSQSNKWSLRIKVQNPHPPEWANIQVRICSEQYYSSYGVLRSLPWLLLYDYALNTMQQRSQEEVSIIAGLPKKPGKAGKDGNVWQSFQSKCICQEGQDSKKQKGDRLGQQEKWHNIKWINDASPFRIWAGKKC